MLTFNELVKEEDRYIIISTLSNMIICNYGSVDMLIIYAKQILKIYKKNSNIRGLCHARTLAKINIASKYPNTPIFREGCMRDPLDIFFTKECAKKYISDPNGFNMRNYYWWNVTYLKDYSNNPYRFHDKGMSRFAKPRVMFLDWVIAVLIAYKNEYNNI